jgi:hypothetical protein
MAVRLLEVFFLPPLAIGRLGGSDQPLEAFDWEISTDPHGVQRTTIRPAVTLEVMADGSARPYLPNLIHFRDGELLRPVAPFFELWARVSRDGAGSTEEPITLGLLRELGVSLAGVRYSIQVGNRKAERRTHVQACAFVARVEAFGDDHARKPLLAISPHNAGEEPLVFPDRPIPLGHFQVIQPMPWVVAGVDLSVLRVRFTPAKGEVYGPPAAIAAMASTVPPGYPTRRLVGRMHEIVRPENRILNDRTPWTQYIWDQPGQVDPQPSDSYDGAHEGTKRSWGVVDDTCDGLIGRRSSPAASGTRPRRGCSRAAPTTRRTGATSSRWPTTWPTATCRTRWSTPRRSSRSRSRSRTCSGGSTS